MGGPSCDRIANGVFIVSSPMCCFHAEVETKDGSRDCQQVCVQTNQVDDEFEGTGSSFGQEMFK